MTAKLKDDQSLCTKEIRPLGKIEEVQETPGFVMAWTRKLPQLAQSMDTASTVLYPADPGTIRPLFVTKFIYCAGGMSVIRGHDYVLKL